MNKLMIDTNIFIYAMNADSEFNADASRILNLENQLFTTSLNISEFFSVASKLRIKHNLIWKFYVSIIENVNILFPNPKSFELFQRLIRKYKPAANKVYDIEINES